MEKKGKSVFYLKITKIFLKKIKEILFTLKKYTLYFTLYKTYNRADFEICHNIWENKQGVIRHPVE